MVQYTNVEASIILSLLVLEIIIENGKSLALKLNNEFVKTE